jgi:hypothetical protein
MTATANEVTINDFNAAEEIAVTNSRVDGLEARLNNFEAGSFSETTAASFSVDAVLGAIDGDTTTEATVFEYQFNIGLSTSFTGEDSLDIAIDSGSDAAATADNPMGFDTGASLSVDGVAYSFPLGGASMTVGNDTDISATFTGACSYSAFTDYMGDCGTGNSIGVGGSGVTATVGYAFDSGFSLAGGISGEATSVSGTSTVSNGLLTKEGTDMYGIEAAYSADSYGIAVAYVSSDGGTGDETTYWGVNATYSFDLADLSVGYETEETTVTETGYFIGLTFPEVGPGSVSIGAGTSDNFADTADELMVYEASYSYPVNDAMTITPGVFIEEKDGDDLTGFLVTTSFSF